MAKVQRSKISVVDSRGRIVITCTAKFYWNPETGGSILPGLKSKVKEACKGVCDLPNVFHLSFIDKEGDPVALLNYGDLRYAFHQIKPDVKRPRLFVFLPASGPRKRSNMKTGRVIPDALVVSKDDDLKLNDKKVHPQHFKMCVVDKNGTTLVSFVTKLDWDRNTSINGYILADLKSKVVSACKGFCELPNVFHLYFIDKEGDRVALLDNEDLRDVLPAASAEPDKLPHLYAYLMPSGPSGRPSIELPSAKNLRSFAWELLSFVFFILIFLVAILLILIPDHLKSLRYCSEKELTTEFDKGFCEALFEITNATMMMTGMNKLL